MYGYNRTRILYAFGIVAGILIVVIGCYVYNSINGDKTKAKVLENQLAIAAKAANYVNDKNFDIMCYGDELGAPDNLIVRQIYGFQHDTVFGIAARPGCAGHMIIINDQHGTVNIDSTQLKDLASRVKEDGVVLVYLGDAKLSTFNQADIGPGAGNPLNPSEIKSFIVCDHGRTRYAGVADDTLYLPGIQIEQNLTEEQIPVYSLIMKFEKTQLYDNIWR